jgi:hypothetical protein
MSIVGCHDINTFIMALHFELINEVMNFAIM